MTSRSQVTVHHAETHLPKLLRRVEVVKEITIARRGEVPDDFDDPLPEDILRAFES